MADELDTDSRRAEARLALGGAEWASKLDQGATALAARRGEAKRAMEGDLRRAARQKLEHLESERAAGLARQAVAEITKTEELRKTLSDTEINRQRADNLARTMTSERLAKAEISADLVEKLKRTAVRLSPIRTYRSDITRAVETEQVSVAGMAIQESKRLRDQPAAASSPKSSAGLSFPLFLITLLLAAAGGAAYYYRVELFTAWQTATQKSTNSVISGKEIIIADQTINLPLETIGQTASDLMLREVSNARFDGQTKVLKFDVTNNGSVLTLEQLTARFNWTMSGGLARALDGKNFVLGAYAPAPPREDYGLFLLAKTSSYDRAVAETLNAEPVLSNDWFAAFNLDRKTDKTVTDVSGFTDQLLNNWNVRQYTPVNGGPTLLYTFFNQEYLAIATSPEAIKELFSRLR